MYPHVTVRRRLVIAAVFVLGMCAGLVRAQPPQPQTGVQPAAALGSSFTYQGQLRDASGPISGTCDLQFKLFDAALVGTQIGATLDRPAITIANGLFTVALSFGPTAFNGQARFLEVAARCPAGSGALTTLSPRQELTPTPYALQSTTSGSTNALRGRGITNTAPTAGQVLEFNGTAWAPAADNDTTYTAGTGLALTGTELSVVTSTVQMRVMGDCAASAIASIAADGSVRCQSIAAEGWRLGGNAGTDPATQFLGTTDAQPLELRVNGVRALRLEPNATSPNLLGGHLTNALLTGAVGVTIAGGGASSQPNLVTDDYGTVGGGVNNQAGDNAGTTVGGSSATVSGGRNNIASGSSATVSGGQSNTASGGFATVGGGLGDTASGSSATVSGGQSNTASGVFATVGGGFRNTASGVQTTVSGGDRNIARGNQGTIGGGQKNGVDGSNSTIGGGFANFAGGNQATIGGGGPSDLTNLATSNRVTDDYGTIGGGGNNQAGDNAGTTADRTYATVSGGQSNTASGSSATVSGGRNNTASGSSDTVSGGLSNTASGSSATVSGGQSNTASGSSATVSGGRNNTASGSSDTVSGGLSNTASGSSATVSGGQSNTASGLSATVSGGRNNTASGLSATVGGGNSNTASGSRSFAAGFRARADHAGSFVWSDSRLIDFASTTTNQFSVRATGGIRLVTGIDATTGNPITGCTLPNNSGSFSCTSDRNAKANFAAVDSRAVLTRLLSLPIQLWNYKMQDATIQHMGPMAQDFAQAFALGESNTTISMVDADGVALAGVQGLYQVMQEQNAALKADNTALETRLQAIEQAVQAGGIPLQVDHGPRIDGTLLLVLVLGGLLLLVLGLLAGLLLGRRSTRPTRA